MNIASKLIPGLCLSATLLTGCTLISSEGPVLDGQLQSYFRDSAFPAPADDFAIEPPPDFTTLPDAFRESLDRRVADIESEYERYHALRDWTFDTFRDFEYITTETLSLTELNISRKYNCLTFTSLFVAAARYLGLEAEFQLVFAPPYWDRANDSWINNQHINVSGTVRLPGDVMVDAPSTFNLGYFQATSVRREYRYVVDINPAVVSMASRRKILDEHQVLSLFYSNRSVEMLLKGDLGAAYAYTKAALNSDAASAVAWNNLGVLYNRVGETGMAEQAFTAAVDNDERAYSAISNLARVYRNRGEDARAAELESGIEEFRSLNPYYHAALAEQDYFNGDMDAAREHLLDALERKHNEHNFYHRLAIIALELNDYEAVLQYLDRARRYARGEDRSRFAGKIEALQDIL